MSDMVGNLLKSFASDSANKAAKSATQAFEAAIQAKKKEARAQSLPCPKHATRAPSQLKRRACRARAPRSNRYARSSLATLSALMLSENGLDVPLGPLH